MSSQEPRECLRGLVAAVSPDGVIGVGGRLPWHYPADLQRFKALTLGTTVIMGRKTWESIGRPLPKRRNIVITRRTIAGVDCFASLSEALATCDGDVWFIGGANIYREAMAHANLIDLTFVPDRVVAPDAVHFPEIDSTWQAGPLVAHDHDPRLQRRIYTRISTIIHHSCLERR